MRRRRATNLLLIVLAVYAVAAGLVWHFQRELLYGSGDPVAENIAPPGLNAVRFITEDGLTLYGWFKPPGEAKEIVVFFHGAQQSVADQWLRAQPLLTQGYGALLVEFRGYGGNPGDPSESGILLDARAALNYVLASGINPSRIVLFGRAMGADVAVSTALKTEVGALVLETPFTSFADYWTARFPWLPFGFLLKDRFATIEKIGRVKAPILILHGGRDPHVPIAQGRAVFEAAPAKKEAFFVDDAGDAELFDRGATEAVLDFLERVMQPDGQNGV
ncbi:alpha/beta hydrolase [Oceanibacterium hippocampi]|uniref:2-hydroxy-6-oxononadienedioate/2-hydroxy-6-oxononatrienedioate hydrolase n=1 Tax=Oceanibacterium hippocampi TaxID=745714 RepID=A0A1Y5TYD3_9PROT|nr:alpha/beta hydrolase [Oceanibacterium hippocampi]SLN76889.1 2-hydroxy-6-oxononadienedioate/2-hydroxy-6-oxononatrienedioate hydrolase [Oceanibacterium hippocampi]